MKHYHIILVAVLVGGLATSCKIGKKYTRPELDLPTTIADTNSSDTTTVADIQWPTIYTDTVLQRLVNTALTYNKDLLAAAARVKESRYAHRMEKANLFPKVGATRSQKENMTVLPVTRSTWRPPSLGNLTSGENSAGVHRPVWQPISKPWKDKGPYA